jgi:hypothetical protein
MPELKSQATDSGAAVGLSIWDARWSVGSPGVLSGCRCNSSHACGNQLLSNRRGYVVGG